MEPSVVLQAMKLISQNEFKESQQILMDLSHDLEGESTDVLLMLAHTYIQQDQLEQAHQALKRAMYIDKECTIAYNNAAVVLLTMNSPEEALNLLNLAIEKDPRNPDLWHNKGVALMDLKRLEDAIEAFDQALYLNPKHAMTWNFLALCFHTSMKL
jgi:tetratricopeptide (TPR) repeat protein